MTHQSFAIYDQSQPAGPTKPLEFNDDPKAYRATWLAAGLVVALGLWMGSGLFTPVAPVSDLVDATPVAQSVVVTRSVAQPVEQFFSAVGETRPNRDVWIVPKDSGEVSEVRVARGDLVEAGQVIALFDAAPQIAAVAQAQAELSNAIRELRNAEALLSRGVATNDRVTVATAALSAAEAVLASAQNDLDKAEIKAPFAGRIETLEVNPGQFLQSGTEVARIVDISRLYVSFRVPQHAISDLTSGAPVDVQMCGRETLTGVLTFLGQSADEDTRTFAAEVTLQNEDGAIPGGVSVEVRAPIGETLAHFVSPAVLSMATEGALGVKTIDGDNQVVFTDVEIVQAQADGIWVSGLGAEAGIITVGQGFVRAGQSVSVDAKSVSLAPSAQLSASNLDQTEGDPL